MKCLYCDKKYELFINAPNKNSVSESMLGTLEHYGSEKHDTTIKIYKLFGKILTFGILTNRGEAELQHDVSQKQLQESNTEMCQKN